MSIYQLFYIDSNSDFSLQKQIREQIVKAINKRQIPLKECLPSSRKLSFQLGVSRNTVILAYDHLVNDGYLIVIARSGYFVNPDVLEGKANEPETVVVGEKTEWSQRFRSVFSISDHEKKAVHWRQSEYPFISGQLDYSLFPTNSWRECCRDAYSASSIKDWMVDQYDYDDPLLIEQIHQRLLPRRGIWVEPEQILLTVGSQHALFLLAYLLFGKREVIGLEDPGYVDARNIASMTPATLKPLEIDGQGVVLNEEIDECHYIYVTPSHQFPTTVTMPMKRRYELLERVTTSDTILIEDDYENEINYGSNPLPAIKSLDKSDRVIYLSSLSKTLSPGLRLGYVVGSVELIKELRRLRSLMLRHPASNNQRIVALFLARGYHDTLARKITHTYEQRYQILRESFNSYFSSSLLNYSFGGASCWVNGPENLDARKLQCRAEKEGVLIEPGDLYYLSDNSPLNFFRLGFSSIENRKIKPGIKILSKIINELI